LIAVFQRFAEYVHRSIHWAFRRRAGGYRNDYALAGSWQARPATTNVTNFGRHRNAPPTRVNANSLKYESEPLWAIVDLGSQNAHTIAYTNDGWSIGMHFVSVRELSTRSATVWDILREEKDLVVTSNGKPIAVLSATTASTLEASLAALRQARAQLAVAAMQERARETGADRLTLEDVNAEIQAVRRQRRK